MIVNLPLCNYYRHRKTKSALIAFYKRQKYIQIAMKKMKPSFKEIMLNINVNIKNKEIQKLDGMIY
jgi:hypothetical protein